MAEVFEPTQEYNEQAKRDKKAKEENLEEKEEERRKREWAARVSRAGRSKDTLGPEPDKLDAKVTWLVRKRVQCKDTDCSRSTLTRLRGMGNIGPALMAVASGTEATAVTVEALRLVGVLELKDMAVGVAQHLEHRRSPVRDAACTTLGWLKSEKAAVPIVERLHKAGKTSERVCLLGALGHIPGSVSLKALSRAASSRVNDEALRAVVGLGRRKEAQSAQALEAAVSLSEFTPVKHAALRALGGMRTSHSKKVLKRLAKSPDSDVRARARALLKRR